jgi:hypothetical protein
MFKSIQEFNTLKKNEDMVWYFKVKDSNKFDLLRNRELTFCDEFNGDRLDTSKWLTNYYWGDKLLHEGTQLKVICRLILKRKILRSATVF